MDERRDHDQLQSSWYCTHHHPYNDSSHHSNDLRYDRRHRRRDKHRSDPNHNCHNRHNRQRSSHHTYADAQHRDDQLQLQPSDGDERFYCNGVDKTAALENLKSVLNRPMMAMDAFVAHMDSAANHRNHCTASQQHVTNDVDETTTTVAAANAQLQLQEDELDGDDDVIYDMEHETPYASPKAIITAQLQHNNNHSENEQLQFTTPHMQTNCNAPNAQSNEMPSELQTTTPTLLSVDGMEGGDDGEAVVEDVDADGDDSELSSEFVFEFDGADVKKDGSNKCVGEKEDALQRMRQYFISTVDSDDDGGCDVVDLSLQLRPSNQRREKLKSSNTNGNRNKTRFVQIAGMVPSKPIVFTSKLCRNIFGSDSDNDETKERPETAAHAVIAVREYIQSSNDREAGHDETYFPQLNEAETHDDDDSATLAAGRDYNLTLYAEGRRQRVMQCELNMDDFEGIFLGRLRMFEWCSSLSYAQRMDVVYNCNNDAFERKLQECKMDEALFDDYTHLLFRLSFCQNRELQKWFITKECAFWRIKYLKSSETARHYFLRDVCHANGGGGNTRYKRLGLDDLVEKGLNGVSPIPKLAPESATEKWVPFHLVPFEEILFLVSKRRVLLRDGKALVPNYLFYLVLEEKYRTHLQRQLDALKAKDLLSVSFLARHPRFAAEIQKIRFVFNGFVLQRISSRKSRQSDRLSSLSALRYELKHDNISTKYARYFPFCMKLVLNELLTRKHLKNGARLQLSLFLKNIGLSRQDALRFWRKYDHKMTQSNKYEWNVSYQYGHNYGGSSCANIINKHTNAGDCNGCPLKRFENKQRGQVLAPLIKRFYPHIAMDVIENYILATPHNSGSKNGMYTLQCKRLFEMSQLSHDAHAAADQNDKDESVKVEIDIEDIVSQWSHPNRYFDIAYALHNNAKEFHQRFHKKTAQRITFEH